MALPVSDPVMTLSEIVRELARREGYTDVRPGAALVDEEGITIDVDGAFSPTGMLPLLVQHAAQIYTESGLDRGAWKFPFEVVEDPDGLLGLAVRWANNQAPFSVGVLCAIDAIKMVIEQNPDPKPVLLLE